MPTMIVMAYLPSNAGTMLKRQVMITLDTFSAHTKLPAVLSIRRHARAIA